tara:strand:- start:12866 stop:13309 length:444 start_codon:yes stop_codon:yes gene_type:complete
MSHSYIKHFLYNDFPTTFLDIGCGTGKNMIYANKLGYDTYGIDNSQIAIDICKNKKLNVTKLDLLNLQLSKKFDRIFCNFLHIKSQNAIINLILHLDIKGELIISIPNTKIKSFYDFIKNINEIIPICNQFNIIKNMTFCHISRLLD